MVPSRTTTSAMASMMNDRLLGDEDQPFLHAIFWTVLASAPGCANTPVQSFASANDREAVLGRPCRARRPAGSA